MDVELETFMLFVTAPIWITAFLALALAGWVNDRRSGR